MSKQQLQKLGREGQVGAHLNGPAVFVFPVLLSLNSISRNNCSVEWRGFQIDSVLKT
jgi:hypothetical protein